MLSMHELSLRMPEPMLSLSMLILATYPEAALDGTINIRSGTKRQIDAPSDRPLEHQIGTRNQIEKIEQTPDRQMLSDRPERSEGLP